MNPSSCNSACIGSQRTPPQRILPLPVVVRANARIRFAPLQPSPATAMPPHEALAYLEKCMQQGHIDAVEVAGPGDPLAAVETTLATLRLISERYPDLPLSLTTLAIGGEQYASDLRLAGLTYVKIKVDAVDAACLEKIYSWIRPGKKTLPLPEAAQILIDDQYRAIPAFKNAGMAVSAVTTVYPDINTNHIEAIARSMAACGVDNMILQPYLREEGADIPLPFADETVMAEAERICMKYLPTLISAGASFGSRTTSGLTLPQPTQQRPNVAVASSSGLDIDLHLGQARQLLIYGPREDGLICLLETRPAPEPGGTGKRWQILATKLTDCFAILAASAGETPRSELAQEGITVMITEDTIEGKVDVLYGGGKKGKQCRK
jgi:nitrogen fixation protein NifB